MKQIWCILSVLVMAGCGYPDLNRESAARVDIYGEGLYFGTDNTFGRDTTVWIALVDVGASYDWRKDITFNAEDFTLTLYRNKTPVITINGGTAEQIGPEPDRHHICQGNIYTEYFNGLETVIKRNGLHISSVPGRQSLKGVLESGRNPYLLFKSLSDGSISLKQGDFELFNKEEGEIIHGFNDNNAGENGALFYRDTVPCFLYSTLANSKLRAYLVAGRTQSEFNMSEKASTLLDASFNGDKLEYLASSYYGSLYYDKSKKETDISLGQKYIWTKATIVRAGDNPVIAGEYELSDGRVVSGYYKDGQIHETGPEDSHMLFWGEQCLTLSFNRNGLLSISGDVCRELGTACYNLSESALDYQGRLFIGVNPRKSGEAPFLWADGTILCEFPVNGYISCINVDVSHSI